MRHAKAESLIETIVAITVIVLATTAAMKVLRVSLEGNELIGEKVVAINLAEEAFEALRNIRDTNYLLFASDPDNCWNKLEVADVDDCSDGSAQEIADGKLYYLTRDFNSDPLYKWHLRLATDPSTDGYLDLYGLDIDGDGTNDTQMYAQTGISSLPNMKAALTNRQLYQRQILISDVTDDSYVATVTISWTEKGQTKSLTLTRSISNVF
jgi:hypothetical protein